MHLFIAGFPRCGTTSLFRYLSDHPGITPTKYVEGCYFIDKGFYSSKYEQSKLPKYYEAGVEGYYKIFKESKALTYLDSTPDYAFQDSFKEALKEIKDFKIIFLMRNPVERIFSFFSFSKGKLARIPPSMSFSEFIEVIINGGKDFDEYVNLKNIIDHSNYVKYLNSLEEFKDHFILIKHESMVNHQLKEIKNICNHAGLDADFYDSYTFEHFNSSVNLKSQFLQRLYNRLPLPKSVRYNEGRLKRFIRDVYRKLNYGSKEVVSEEDLKTKDLLKELLLPSIRELNKKYDIPVDDWL